MQPSQIEHIKEACRDIRIQMQRVSDIIADKLAENDDVNLEIAAERMKTLERGVARIEASVKDE